jgi:hypothetical protein
MGFFLARSFGIIALLAAVFALLACRGPWLQAYPAWFVIVPAGLSILLACLGILLLRLRAITNSSYGGRLMVKAVIVLATIGGIVLTHFFHGDTDADRTGTDALWRILQKMSIPLLIGALLFTIVTIAEKFINKTKEPRP